MILFRRVLVSRSLRPVLKNPGEILEASEESGVFIVRLYLGDHRPGKIKFRVKRKIDLIKSKFDVLESPQYDTPGLPTVLVFGPR